MDTLCLNNKDEFPSDKVLSRYLGETKELWDSFLQLLNINYPDLHVEWRYYHDGKSWLMKVTKKSKTICWVGVLNKKFRITFYFSDKANMLIKNSTLASKYIKQFMASKQYGKIKGITVLMKKETDLIAVKKLIGIKEQIK